MGASAHCDACKNNVQVAYPLIPYNTRQKASKLMRLHGTLGTKSLPARNVSTCESVKIVHLVHIRFYVRVPKRLHRDKPSMHMPLHPTSPPPILSTVVQIKQNIGHSPARYLVFGAQAVL
jgi:hypothetical protein